MYLSLRTTNLDHSKLKPSDYCESWCLLSEQKDSAKKAMIRSYTAAQHRHGWNCGGAVHHRGYLICQLHLVDQQSVSSQRINRESLEKTRHKRKTKTKDGKIKNSFEFIVGTELLSLCRNVGRGFNERWQLVSPVRQPPHSTNVLSHVHSLQ